jgi:uncharacterized protein YjbJ (UPF0337 family)
MSIATDIRSYADSAVTQGKQVLDSTITTAQAQLNDVTGQANEFYGKTKENVSEIAEKATAAVHDLRAQAEKAVNLEALKTAVEPYLTQVKGYTHQVTDRAESLFGTVKSDPRVAKLVGAAEVVLGTVQERVVKPVQSLTGRGAATPAAKPAPTAAAKPAATKPAATKPATPKPATKPAARKAPAKRTPQS